MQKFLDTPKTPIVVNRGFDVFFIALWLIYALWAIASGIEHIPSMKAITDGPYQYWYSGAIGTAALVAATAATMGFYPTPMKRVSKERMEMFALIAFTGLVFVYPCILFYNVIFLGDIKYLSAMVLSLSYMVAPIYRAIHLASRIKRNV